MTTTASKIIAPFFTAATLMMLLLILAGRSAAQEEVASALRRYKDLEVSTGYYEEYEVLPSRQRPVVSVPGVQRGRFPYSPTAAQVRIRTRLADSHQGIKFYNFLRCEFCHADETKDIHTVRANITCRQCHGGEPIASIEHFYSPMNPIRRHAYVCAKCHEGASASFASYVVHEPAAGSTTARREFPLLYYSYWFMLLLLVGTLAFFIPHTFLVGVRELFANFKLKWAKREHEPAEEQEDEDTQADVEPSDASNEKTDDDKKQNDVDIRDYLEDEQQNEKDREQILEKLAKIKDQFSLSIYKKVYNISDDEKRDDRRDDKRDDRDKD